MIIILWKLSSVTPKEIGKINGYITIFDSLAQVIEPLLVVFLLGLNPLLYGIATGTLAFGAFIMIFKKIAPLMKLDQFQQV